ncbi:hypothetical protein [Lichenicoccus sp.]|uniref:hypothetical protein n=1 Tax=Lichenicoccus sp. TaxID=2781899 RepID=UPI003D0CB8A6
MEISSSNLSQAGDFFIQVAIDTKTSGGGPSWFDAETLDVTLQMGFLPPGAPEGALSWQTMLSGRVDRIHCNPVSGLVTLEGRDYAARLLDLPVSETFLNCTSSEVAQQLAGRCGLTASVDQTSTFIGQYYQIEHARLSMAPFSRFGTAWDLLSSLAQVEQFDLWVQDLTLNFRTAPPATSAALQITFQEGRPTQASPILNVSSLSLERNLALAGDLPVVVSSWNSRQRSRVQVQAGSSSVSGGSAIRILRPNLPADTAQTLANAISNTVLSHQRTLTATMAGDLDTTARSLVQMTGLGAPWDGTYRVAKLEREMTMHGGFVQRLTAQGLAD